MPVLADDVSSQTVVVRCVRRLFYSGRVVLHEDQRPGHHVDIALGTSESTSQMVALIRMVHPSSLAAMHILRLHCKFVVGF